MRYDLLRLVRLLFAFSVSAGFAGAAERPNILFILADDLGWKDVGWHGGTAATPNLDALVKSGVELDNAYVQPMCTPTRVALLTGRFPSRFGPHAIAPSNRRVLPPGTVTLASALESLGYHTYMVGKWHLGSRPEWGPNHYGFQESYGMFTGAIDPWTHLYREGPFLNTWNRNGQIFEEKGNAMELLTRQACDWIAERKTPWFLYFAMTAVHTPMDAPDRYKERYQAVKFSEDPVKDDSLRRLAACLTQMDDCVGQVVAALDQSGQRDRTIIVFCSDNGGARSVPNNPYRGTVAGSPANSNNDPLRGQKGKLYEGGIRVPAFVNWPKALPPRKLAQPIHAVDWFPTLAGLTGWRPSAEPRWDGQNMWPILSGQAAEKPRTFYWIAQRGQRAVRAGDWKLIATLEDKTIEGLSGHDVAEIEQARGFVFDGLPARYELFNIAEDPEEKNDLAAKDPGKVEELRKLLDEFGQNDLKQMPPEVAKMPL